MKKLLLPLFALIIFAGFRSPVLKTITGTVISKTDKLPVPGVTISAVNGSSRTTTDKNGKFKISVGDQEKQLRFSFTGYRDKFMNISRADVMNVSLEPSPVSEKHISYDLQEAVIEQRKNIGMASKSMPAPVMVRINTESYAAINENEFHAVQHDPLSTLSIDVDAASYSNLRRFINNGNMPPADAVRIEEMINYFDYEYPQPQVSDPVNIVTEISVAPWNARHKIVQIGLQARTIPTDNLPASNLVFLIDVSGSMSSENKLPLLISSFKMLTDQLRDKDRVAIVVYAGNSGLVLPPTAGSNKVKIKEALSRLSAGGSTAGGEGIKLAYNTAREHFIKGGNNRVILATDGDFNVGASSDRDMEKLIEEERKSGVFLTVLGYGMGNYKDSKMETLADKGNGNYAYIDNITEARKVLVKEFGGTLFTIAKDVKLQIEFNPAKVQAYRLIGYENRMLNKEDFNNDKKDAGELGSGHTVTALYEIIPVGVKSSFIGSVDELKYQPAKLNASATAGSEMLTVKLRYKQPDGDVSRLLQKAVTENDHPSAQTSNNFRFAAAVAEFGMLLRNSDFKQNSSFEQVISLAEGALGRDKDGYRNEFLALVKSAKLMAVDLLTIKDKKIMNEKN